MLEYNAIHNRLSKTKCIIIRLEDSMHHYNKTKLQTRLMCHLLARRCAKHCVSCHGCMKQGRHSGSSEEYNIISCNFEHDHPCWLAAIRGRSRITIRGVLLVHMKFLKPCPLSPETTPIFHAYSPFRLNYNSYRSTTFKSLKVRAQHY